MTPSEVIRQHKDEIISRWRKLLLEKVPSASQHGKIALENNIPYLLNALVIALEAEQSEEIIFHSEQHGLTRSKFRDYSVGHIVKEYNLMKQVLFSKLDEMGIMEIEGRNLIIYAFDQAIEQAAETYHRLKNEVQVDARKMAEQKAEKLQLTGKKKEAFVEAVTQDLNNLLLRIKAGTEKLENLDVEQVGTVLSLIRDNLDQAEFMVKDFLSVSDPESDKVIVLQKVHTDILEELKKEVETYKVIKAREIVFETQDEQIMAELDVVLVRRAFINLLNSAIKFSQPASKILISCQQNNKTMQISVSTSANTLAPELLKMLPERYDLPDKGSAVWGVGLDFVNKVAHAHEGTLEVIDDNDKITFVLLLPLR